jgi:hypothetical protein
MSNMKHRSGASIDPGDVPLHEQGGYTHKGKREYEIVEGKFDALYLREVGVWVHIVRNQQWTMDVYNRESGQVETLTKTWYQFTDHYHNATKRHLVCSAGAYLDKPCLPHDINKKFYEARDAEYKATKVRSKQRPSVGSSPRFAFSTVVMEWIYSVPLTDSSGKVRTTRDGAPIFKNVPGPFVDKSIRGGLNRKFGHRFHLANSTEALHQLLALDKRLANNCKHCARSLYADTLKCPECKAPQALESAVEGEDLGTTREEHFACVQCSYRGPMFPVLQCACGNPKSGGLTSFDVRLRKEPTGETGSVILCTGVRIPLDDIKDTDALSSAMQALQDGPLDLYKIYAPTPIEEQRRVLGKDTGTVERRAGATGYTSDNDKSAESAESDEIPY